MSKDIFGIAINDYFKGQYTQDITVRSPDFEDDSIPLPYLFRDYETMPPLEQRALQLVQGKVLDIGCGAGSHSLYLQQQGIKVTAIDISKGAIAVCQKRGVLDAQIHSLYQPLSQKYDTILLLMNGSGIIGKLENLPFFLNTLHGLLNKGGQVLMDSSDLCYLFESEDGGLWIDTHKAYYGEMRYQLRYKEQHSAWFDWLYIDFETLKKACLRWGWNCELLQEGSHYDYLARLHMG